MPCHLLRSADRPVRKAWAKRPDWVLNGSVVSNVVLGRRLLLMMFLPTREKRPVLILVIGLAVTAVDVAWFALRDRHEFGSATWWQVLLLVAGFVLAGKVVVHLDLGSESGAVTFVELPLFLAAFFISPVFVWLAMTIGVAISLVAIERLPLLKAGFNVANASLQAALGLWIFHLLLQHRASSGPWSWMSVATAAVVSGVVALAALTLVMILVGERTGIRPLLFMGVVSSVVNVSLALLGATLISAQPLALVFLVLPAALVRAAYRADLSDRAQRARVRSLYELALEVRSIRDQSAIMPVLQSLTSHMQASRCELVIFSSDSDQARGVRFRVDPHGHTVRTLSTQELAEVQDALPYLPAPRRIGSETSGKNEAEIIAPLMSDAGALGILLVGDRVSGVHTFSEDDLAMFSAIAEQLGLALENEQLGKAVAQLEARGLRLAHEATHDPLTRLANRTLFEVRLDSALSSGRLPSLLYIDLDGFKAVNDEHGHDAGDRVLIAIARRFASAVGPEDCVARMGGDEFAVLLGEFSDDEGVAQSLLNAASEPIALANGTIEVQASVGIARAVPGIESSELVRRADEAMYVAKGCGNSALMFA